MWEASPIVNQRLVIQGNGAQSINVVLLKKQKGEREDVEGSATKRLSSTAGED